MQIIVTFMNDAKKDDFQINNHMKIKDALGIINDNSEFHIKKTNYIFSQRKQEQISTERTFQDVGIYSGDCLEVEEE